MTRKEQISEVKRVVTMVKGRGSRIHTYSVAELKAEVAKLLADSYYTVIPSRKTLEDFAK